MFFLFERKLWSVDLAIRWPTTRILIGWCLLTALAATRRELIKSDGFPIQPITQSQRGKKLCFQNIQDSLMKAQDTIVNCFCMQKSREFVALWNRLLAPFSCSVYFSSVLLVATIAEKLPSCQKCAKTPQRQKLNFRNLNRLNKSRGGTGF